MKVIGDAPAIPMGNLFATAAMFSNDARLVAKTASLFDHLLDLPADSPPPAISRDGLYAAMPAASFDWSESGGKDGGGKEGGNHGPARGAGDDAGLTTALSLFKGFGHGDLDL